MKNSIPLLLNLFSGVAVLFFILYSPLIPGLSFLFYISPLYTGFRFGCMGIPGNSPDCGDVAKNDFINNMHTFFSESFLITLIILIAFLSGKIAAEFVARKREVINKNQTKKPLAISKIVFLIFSTLSLMILLRLPVNFLDLIAETSVQFRQQTSLFFSFPIAQIVSCLLSILLIYIFLQVYKKINRDPSNVSFWAISLFTFIYYVIFTMQYIAVGNAFDNAFAIFRLILIVAFYCVIYAYAYNSSN